MLRLLPIALAALILSWLATIGIDAAQRLSSHQTLGVDVLLQAPWSDDTLMLFGVVAGLILIEAPAAGWRNSALRRLLRPSESALMDWIYLILGVSGLLRFASIVVTLGLAAVVSQADGPLGDWRPAAGLPVWLAAPLCYLAIAFVNYWRHRLLMHGLLWDFHAVHHAPGEFTILNVVRTHPVDLVLGVVAQSLPVVALGFSPEATGLALIVLEFEAAWQHSNIRGVEWLERVGIFSPLGHALHHSIDPAHHHRNFGDLLCVWDHLFGTYLPASAAPDELTLGVESLPTPRAGCAAVLHDLLAPWRLLMRRVGLACARRARGAHLAR